MAVVLRIGLFWNEAGRELAVSRQVLPPVRCRDRSRARDWTRVVYLVALAEPVAA